MKILNIRPLALNEANMMGDTHKGLHVALGRVNKGMQDLGLTPAGMAAGVMAGGEKEGIDRKGQRHLTMIFAQSEQDAQNGSPNNIQIQLRKVEYQRKGEKIRLYTTTGLNKVKYLEFYIEHLVNDPTENEIYEIKRIVHNDLVDTRINTGYTHLVFTYIKKGRGV